jgi:rubredoxin
MAGLRCERCSYVLRGKLGIRQSDEPRRTLFGAASYIRCPVCGKLNWCDGAAAASPVQPARPSFWSELAPSRTA